MHFKHVQSFLTPNQESFGQSKARKGQDQRCLNICDLLLPNNIFEDKFGDFL